MKITDYLLNKDLKISEKDFDIEKMENDIRRGYIKETDVESKLDSSKKIWEAENKKTYDELNSKYSALEKSYNDTVSNLDKANKDLSNEKLKVTMMSKGFKPEQFEEVAKLRESLFSDETDDEKAISGIAEKFRGTYFATQQLTGQEGSLKGNGGTVAKTIEVNRNTPIKNLIIRK